MVWGDDRLFVWGGYEYTGMGDEEPRQDGFVYELAADAWADLPEAPLSPRAGAVGAWTGEEFLVWGGVGSQGTDTAFHDGAAFDPVSRTWRLLPIAPIEGRAPLGVWTGDELIVWGTSYRVDEPPIDGAAYNPETDSWRPIADGPIAFTDATAAWTGAEMIVFGAELQGGNDATTPTAIGAAYDPETDSWRRLPDSTLSPQASTAAWNGYELIAWDYLNRSAAYDPQRDEWRELPDLQLDDAECSPESVAVRGLVFGDYCGPTVIFETMDDSWLPLPGVRCCSANRQQHLVAADDALLLLTRNIKTGSEAFFAFKPSFPRGTSRYHLSLGNIIHRDGRYRLTFAADWEGPGKPQKELCVARGLSPGGQVVDTIRFHLKEEGTRIERLWPQIYEGAEIASLEMTCRPLR